MGLGVGIDEGIALGDGVGTKEGLRLGIWVGDPVSGHSTHFISMTC